MSPVRLPRFVTGLGLGLGLGWSLSTLPPTSPQDALSRRVWRMTLPAEGGIVQRDRLPGHLLAARTGLRVDRVEVNVGGADLRPEGWTPLGQVYPGFFAGRHALSPGWNLVAMRAYRGDQGTWTGSGRVGVGEVFLVAGQSNAVGSARTLFRAAADVRSGRLQSDGTLAWRPGDDPQQEGAGGSPWPALGALIAAQEGVPVGFINVAMGGTHIGEWAVGSPLHARLVRALEATRPYGVRAVLWQQGETSRSGRLEHEDRDYHDTLAALIEAVGRTAGVPRAPWVVAQVGYTSHGPHPGHRRAQSRLWKEGLALAGPDLDDLGPAWREPDLIHLNGRAQAVVARRWLSALRRHGLLGARPPAP